MSKGASSPRVRRPYRRRIWTEAEIRALRTLFPHVRTIDAARILGRDYGSVSRKAVQLGIRKSAAFRRSALSGHMIPGHTRGIATRFKKGHVPWTAGRKGLHLSPATQFKKGQRPYNRQPIGSERVTKDGILQRKVSDTGYPPRDWKSVHSLSWIERHGPIPLGHVVIFRDGNRANFADYNLQLITRADNMRRNSIHHVPEPLKSIIYALGRLNRRLNEKQDRRPA